MPESNLPEPNWKQIPAYDPKTPRPQCKDLSNFDALRLAIACKVLNKSAPEVLQTALITYLRRNWPEHLKAAYTLSFAEEFDSIEAFLTEIAENIKK